MRQKKIFLLIFIALLFLVTFFLNLPKNVPIVFKSPIISVNQSIYLGDVGGFLSSVGFTRDISIRKGLDLEGGTSITLKADMEDIPDLEREDALESTRGVIERRVNFFGVSEPVVQTSKANKEYRILVEIPGVTDVNQAVQLIGTTAQLTFWEEGPPLGQDPEGQASGSAAVNSDEIPLNSKLLLGENPVKTDLTGSDLKRSSVTFNETASPVVQLEFTAEGRKKFADITKRNTGKRLGFALDDVMIDAPVVQTAILDGNAVISGSFTTDQAKALQLQLNAGALPVSLSVLQQETIGATLGAESVQKSIFAGGIGLVAVVIFMIALYGRLGIVASFALLLYALINLTIFRLLPVTLTLAGIAGFILSIGIAVDANILIFERMKEEIRRGRSRETALKLGFQRAWTSIRDSNIASLITSAILYYFGSGMIKGFALVLAIGILVSMFSAITITRTLLEFIYRPKIQNV